MPTTPSPTPFFDPTAPPHLHRARPARMINYGVSAEADGLLTWQWASDRLRASRNYWLSTTRADGRPHAAPLWAVWLDDALCFGVDPNSVKARNFAHQPWAVMHAESGDEVVILEGTPTPLTDLNLFARVAADYAAKYNITLSAPTDPSAALLILRPQIALAWLESSFPTTATRWATKPR